MAGETELERMVIRLIGDASSYKKMLKDADKATKTFESKLVKQLKNTGEKLKRVGKTLTLAITAPLVGFAALAIKEFAQLETALNRMQGLVGLTAGVVAGFAEDIKRVSKETAISARELAEAMFFITSAGLRGADATEALAIAAKAAAIGMGSTVSISDALTSAMNAYGPSVLSATRATEILTAAVREGKAEAASFAPVLGQVLPTAVELGITFAEAAGTIAFLTKATGSASLAATGFRGIMAQLVRTTAQTNEALEQIGMTTDELRRSVREKGLLTTLLNLRKEFKAQGIPISKMFADIEGLNAILQLTGKQAEDAAKVIHNVGESAGIVDEAFKIVTDTLEFKWMQAMNDVKLAMLDLGKTLAPIAIDIAERIKGVAEWWNNLSEAVQDNIITTAKYALALGPVVWGLGKVSDAVRVLLPLLASLRVALTSAFLVKGLGITALGAAMVWLADQVGLFGEAATGLEASQERVRKALKNTNTMVEKQIELLKEAAELEKEEKEKKAEKKEKKDALSPENLEKSRRRLQTQLDNALLRLPIAEKEAKESRAAATENPLVFAGVLFNEAMLSIARIVPGLDVPLSGRVQNIDQKESELKDISAKIESTRTKLATITNAQLKPSTPTPAQPRSRTPFTDWKRQQDESGDFPQIRRGIDRLVELAEEDADTETVEVIPSELSR